MTCKNCLHSRVCFDSEGTTRYYGTEIAADNVEDLCPCFADRSRYVVREKGEWQYTDDIDEDGNIQAYCSACGAGDKHATSMVGKVPYCWNCGADMRKEKNNA